MLWMFLQVLAHPLSGLLDVPLELLGLYYTLSPPPAVVAGGPAFLASSLFAVGFHCRIVKIEISKPFGSAGKLREAVMCQTYAKVVFTF